MGTIRVHRGGRECGDSSIRKSVRLGTGPCGWWRRRPHQPLPPPRPLPPRPPPRSRRRRLTVTCACALCFTMSRPPTRPATSRSLPRHWQKPQARNSQAAPAKVLAWAVNSIDVPSPQVRVTVTSEPAVMPDIHQHDVVGTWGERERTVRRHGVAVGGWFHHPIFGGIHHPGRRAAATGDHYRFRTGVGQGTERGSSFRSRPLSPTHHSSAPAGSDPAPPAIAAAVGAVEAAVPSAELPLAQPVKVRAAGIQSKHGDRDSRGERHRAMVGRDQRPSRRRAVGVRWPNLRCPRDFDGAAWASLAYSPAASSL